MLTSRSLVMQQSHAAAAAPLASRPRPTTLLLRAAAASDGGSIISSSSSGVGGAALPPLPQRQQQQQAANSSPSSSQQAPKALAAPPPPPSAPPPPPPLVRRPRRRRLLPSDFQHPLDQQNTTLLRALPGLEAAARAILTSPAVEEALVIDNLASSVKAGPMQLSTLHGLMSEAAAALDLEGPLPDLYVRQHPTPNAYTLATLGRRPFVVVHTSLLDLLPDKEELRAVLAHEAAHLKCEHGTYLTAANALATAGSGLLPFVGPALEGALLRWARAAELTCDRGALLATGCPRAVVGALMRLAGGSRAYASELRVDAFLEQARDYQDATARGVGRAIAGAQARSLTHPLPVIRAREIDRWASSPQYRRLAALQDEGGAAAGVVTATR